MICKRIAAFFVFSSSAVLALAQNTPAPVARTTSPEQRYQSMVVEYNQGKNDPRFLRNLAEMAISFKDQDTADKIIGHFYKDAANIDHALGTPGYSENFVDGVIRREEISPVLYPGHKMSLSEPDWSGLTATITERFDKTYAERDVLFARADWAYRHKDYPTFAKFIDERFTKYPPHALPGLDGDPWALNVHAWHMFLQSSDKEVLTSALKWSEMSLQLDAELAKKGTPGPWGPGEFLDTKANLLYKLGKVQEAIALEEEAVGLANNDQQMADLRRKAVALMKDHQPTWTGALP